MAKESPAFKHIAKMVASQLSSPAAPVTSAMVEKGSNAAWVGEFLGAGADGVEPRMALLFFLQPKDGATAVFMTDGSSDQLSGKCCYVVRLSDPFQPLPTKDLEDAQRHPPPSSRDRM